MLTVIIMRIARSERQKTVEPVVSKEQAITASLKTLLNWEKEIHIPIVFISEGESRTVVEFWCEICCTFVTSFYTKFLLNFLKTARKCSMLLVKKFDTR
jgi:hypothetical protein